MANETTFDLQEKISMRLDLGVCRSHWMRSVLSPNLSPGQTVVLFSHFSTILVMARKWKTFGDPEAAALCKRVFGEIFPGAHKADVDYEPLPMKVVNGNLNQFIAEPLIKAKFELIGEMALTAENCFLAAFDMQAVARYYVETIIDASKKGTIVIIENLGNLKRLKSLSRQDLGFHIDWNRNVPVKDWKPRIVARKGEPQPVVLKDIFQDVRMNGIDKAMEMSRDLLKVKQVFGPEWVDWVNKQVAPIAVKKYIELARRVKQMYYSLNQVKTWFMMHQPFSRTTEERQSYEKGLKQTFNAEYDHLRNMFRAATPELNVPQRIAVLMWVTLHDKKAESVEVSSFSQDLFEEEFFLFVMGTMASDPRVPQYTEDKLDKVVGFSEDDSEEDRTVDFVFGEYESDDGKKAALASSPDLDGTFLLRKNAEGRWVASRRIVDQVEVPAGDPTHLTFITKVDSSDQVEAARVNNVLMPGTTITLVPSVPLGQDKKMGDFAVIDGKGVFEFRLDPKVEDPVTHKSYYKKDGVIRKLYTNMQGEIESTVIGEVKCPQGPRTVAIITLKDARRVTRPQKIELPEVETQKEEAAAEEVKKQPAEKKVYKTSFLDGATEV